MATLADIYPTLVDLAKRLDPDGKIAEIVELLAQQNEILADLVYQEANGVTSHRITVRTGLPTVVWRLLNRGVPPSKSRTAQVDEAMGQLEARSEVDVKLTKLSGNVAEFRLSEAMAFIEAMMQEKASTLFYGNTTVSPEEFTGLAPRYSDLSAEIGQNILDGGGTGSDNTSIWLVVWGPNTIHGIFPRGSVAGLEHEDLGIIDAFDSDDNRFRAYADLWQWDCGIALKDWRYAVRIANIDVSDLDTGSAADLTKLMIKAIHRIPNFNNGRAAFYMNRTVFQYLDIERLDSVKAGGGLVYRDVDGKAIPFFRGIPIRRVDALLETEAQVT